MEPIKFLNQYYSITKSSTDLYDLSILLETSTTVTELWHIAYKMLYFKDTHKLIIRTAPTSNKGAEECGLVCGQLKLET